MGGPYYSQRQEQQGKGPDRVIGRDFCAAFIAYLSRISSEGYLCESFPDECVEGGVSWRDDRAIAGRLIEELGAVKWPLTLESLPPTDRMLDLLEFLFQHVSRPDAGWNCRSCGCCHPSEYNVPKGRLYYTIQVNKMMERFHHPYRLKKGRIYLVGSEVLDRRLFGMELKSDDEALVRLVSSALDAFLDRSGSRKIEGLRNIVDAFDRLKTLHGTDKKASAEVVISTLTSFDDARSGFREHFTGLTRVSNEYNIRHHERDKKILQDDYLIEYLFYAYYNLVRLILEKHGMTSSSPPPGGGDP